MSAYSKLFLISVLQPFSSHGVERKLKTFLFHFIFQILKITPSLKTWDFSDTQDRGFPTLRWKKNKNMFERFPFQCVHVSQTFFYFYLQVIATKLQRGECKCCYVNFRSEKRQEKKNRGMNRIQVWKNLFSFILMTWRFMLTTPRSVLKFETYEKASKTRFN